MSFGRHYGTSLHSYVKRLLLHVGDLGESVAVGSAHGVQENEDGLVGKHGLSVDGRGVPNTWYWLRWAINRNRSKSSIKTSEILLDCSITLAS